jgi:uncharacterized protein YcgL (UPF0745 family)
MRCVVYRSDKRPGTYVYTIAGEGLERVPPALRQSLAPLVEALSFELTPDRRLARADAAVVLANLCSAGFHIQFPRSEWERREA